MKKFMIMDTKKLIIQQNSSQAEKMRSQAEIRARYQLDCQQYKSLKNNSDGNNQDHLLMLYTEIKLLGWVLGKTEQTVIRDANS